MRKLLAPLLLLPVLAGANVHSAVRAGDVSAGIDTVATASPSAAQPSLPGYAATAGTALASIVMEGGGSADSWRTGARTQRTHRDPLPAGAHAADGRTHIATLQRSRLVFGHTLLRMRTNEPASFGNPPPASRT